MYLSLFVFALVSLITITSYFCLNIAQYIHVVEYSKCFIMDARVLEKFVRISGVYDASDAPNSLFLQRNYLQMTSLIGNNNKTLFYLLLFN